MSEIKAIQELKYLMSYAIKDMYKSSIYGDPSFAQNEINACTLAISSLETKIPKKLNMCHCQCGMAIDDGWIFCPMCSQAIGGSGK